MVNTKICQIPKIAEAGDILRSGDGLVRLQCEPLEGGSQLLEGGHGGCEKVCPSCLQLKLEMKEISTLGL